MLTYVAHLWWSIYQISLWLCFSQVVGVMISLYDLQSPSKVAKRQHLLIVLGTVNLQFQSPLVPISLQSILRIVAAQVLGTVWSSYS